MDKPVLVQDRSEKEEQLAHACPLTVIADSAHYLHQPGVIQRIVAEALSWPGHPTEIRFDLLAVPDLAGQSRNATVIGLLANDVATAIGLHGSETVLAIGDGQSPSDLIEALRERLSRQDRPLKMAACLAKRPVWTVAAKGAVIGCMDWRLHGKGDLSARSRFAVGQGRTATDTVTVPGVAKDLLPDGLRFEAVVRWIESLRQRGLDWLFLVGHEDCGKYGGHGAFAGLADENRVLSDDLRQAAKRLSGRLPGLDIEIGIAELTDRDTVKRVRRLD